MAHRIIPRSEWGARYADGAGAAALPAAEVWLHHSVTIAPNLVAPWDDDYAAVRALEAIGQSRFGAGISYTFPITPAGLIFQGHSINRKGTHTGGRNSIARAFCFVGNYETSHPTEAQLDAAGWLLAHGFLSGWWKASRLAGGHRDLKSTACPGKWAYASMSDIDRRAKAYAEGAVQLPPAPVPPPPPQPEEEMPTPVPQIIVVSPDDPFGGGARWWITDGVTKRWIKTVEHAAVLVFTGLARWNDGTAFALPWSWVGEIPVDKADPAFAQVTHAEVDVDDLAAKLSVVLEANPALHPDLSAEAIDGIAAAVVLKAAEKLAA